MLRKWRTIWTVALFALPLVDARASSDTEAVTDEKLRQAALRIVFPQMKLSLEPGKRIDDSGPTKATHPDRPFYPDALSREPVYRVIGRASNQAERCASENLLTENFSDDREVRLRVFRWPGRADKELLVLVQYKFLKANPAGSCWSIGMLVHLVSSDGAWHRRDAYLLETQHHSSIQRVELIDLAGMGLPELVVESNFGGAATVGSTLQVFSLGDDRFEEILNTQSRLEADIDEGYAQELDIAGTRAVRAKRFRVTKTIYFEKGTWFSKPRVSYDFYERSSGVDKQAVGYRQQMLAPLN